MYQPTRETFGEWMNSARRFERLGKLAAAGECAREALKVLESHPHLVNNGMPLPAKAMEIVKALAAN